MVIVLLFVELFRVIVPVTLEAVPNVIPPEEIAPASERLPDERTGI